MSATAVILLVGLVSFWGVAGIMAAFLFRFRKTLEALESTLAQVQSDLSELTPAVTGTLREVEKTGEEVGQTAAEMRILTRRVNAGSTPSFLGGAVGYLPAVFGIFRLVKPIFTGRNKR